MTVVSCSSQSDMGDINQENWSNSSIKSCSSVTLWTASWQEGSFSPVIRASITSFTDDSGEIVFLCWPSDFFLKLYLSPVFNNDNTYQHIFTWSYWFWHLEWECPCQKHIVVDFVVVNFMHVVAFVSLLCWCFIF